VSRIGDESERIRVETIGQFDEHEREIDGQEYEDAHGRLVGHEVLEHHPYFAHGEARQTMSTRSATSLARGSSFRATLRGHVRRQPAR
jgi:hypothetical protein